MELQKGSLGFQAGATEIDLVLLVMNRDAASKMLNSKVSLGADASVAAGPVGRAASASTSENLAQVLSYSRSKGAFAGVNLSGGSLRVDKDSNADAYGPTVALDTVINGGGPTIPGSTTFINTLGTNAINLAVVEVDLETERARHNRMQLEVARSNNAYQDEDA